MYKATVTPKDSQLKKYLEPTEFCDSDGLHIKKIAEYILDKTKGDKNQAVEEAFHFVRDHVHYKLGFWQKTASVTLMERSGSCTNSANLLVAIVRAMGIPAGYGVMKVKGQEYFGLAAPKRLASKVKKRSVHIYTYIFLDDAWLPVDPSDDVLLSIGSQTFNSQSTITSFDSRRGACLCLDPEHVISDEGPLASIDFYMKKKMRFISKIAANIGNKYISFLREEGVNFQTPEEAHRFFPIYLRRKRYMLTLLMYRMMIIL